MYRLRTYAGCLTRGMWVGFAGNIYLVDHLSMTTAGVYLELLPLNSNRKRAIHIQMSNREPMEVYIPLM